MIAAVFENVGRIVEKLRAKNDPPSEPTSWVTVTKTVTVYEFEAEGLGRTLVKTVGAVMRGFKWEPSGFPEADVGVQFRPEDGGVPVEAAQMFAYAFSNLETLEGPDGKLKPEFVEAIVATLVGSRPGKEAAMSLAASMIQALAPERHREQLMNELTRLSVEDAIQRSEAADRAAREARGPIITPAPKDMPEPAPKA
jgi:hypothetical protein